jgi:hypothetical protein
LGEAGCRIKNSYLVTVPRHEPDGHDASLVNVAASQIQRVLLKDLNGHPFALVCDL